VAGQGQRPDKPCLNDSDTERRSEKGKNLREGEEARSRANLRREKEGKDKYMWSECPPANAGTVGKIESGVKNGGQNMVCYWGNDLDVGKGFSLGEENWSKKKGAHKWNNSDRSLYGLDNHE